MSRNQRNLNVVQVRVDLHNTLSLLKGDANRGDHKWEDEWGKAIVNNAEHKKCEISQFDIDVSRHLLTGNEYMYH